MALETITYSDNTVKLDGMQQELAYEIALARQNARIALVRMQKFAEEIRAGKHPSINPDEQRAYEVAIQQLRRFRVPEDKRIEYLKALFRLGQDYSEIRKYVQR